MPATGPSLVTLLKWPRHQEPSVEWMNKRIETWLKSDDVFRREFLDGIVLIAEESRNLSSVTESLRNVWKASWILFLDSRSLPRDFPAGPHLVLDRKLYRVFRVYDDVGNAFKLATAPRIKPGYAALLY